LKAGKLNFCTLFDSNYLSRGLALYESLLVNAPGFHLYVFAFDDICCDILAKMNLEGMTVISLKDFEDEELIRVKKDRTISEYCWTCASSTILYAIEKFNLDYCTYIDADLLFYSNPLVLIEEMGSNSVLITEHRYSPEYDQSEKSGRYCVQFITFKSDQGGMRVLHWWRAACIEWCYARFEDGKFGDQKYLDDWTTRFEGVHELQHIGGGVAPWNLQQYELKKRKGIFYIRELSKSAYVPLVFFHFHYLKFFTNDIVKIASEYLIKKEFANLIYVPYMKMLIKISEEVKRQDASFDSNGAKDLSAYTPFDFRDKLHLYKEALLKFSRTEIQKVERQILRHSYYYKNKLK
jgi:hypothetical protein